MELFYTYQVDEQTAYFDENEAGHCIKVMRKKAGDTIHFIDGKGNLYSGEINKTGKSGFECKVISKQHTQAPKRQLHLGVAPVKNSDRLQLMLEKCTETGTYAFTFLQCKNNERSHLNMEKLRKTCVSACKQSQNLYLPQLNELTDFVKFIEKYKNSKEKWVAHCEDLPKTKGFDFNETTQGEIVVLIGPEGDFTPTEISLAIKYGFKPLSMGSLRLRTETAAIWASIQTSISL